MHRIHCLSDLVICLFVLAFLGTDLLGQETQQTPDQTQDSQQQYGKFYTMNFPADWKEVSNPAADLFYRSPKEGENDFQENINVMVAEIPASATMDEIIKTGMEDLKNNNQEFKEIERGSLRLGNTPATFVRYSMKTQGVQVDNDLYIVQDSTKLYMITCTMLAGESRKKFAPIFREIVSTFSLVYTMYTHDGQLFLGSPFSITHPDDWEISQSETINMACMSPLEDENDTFREMMTIVLENNPNRISEEQYVQSAINNMKRSFVDFELMEQQRVYIGKHKSMRMQYRYNNQGIFMDNDAYIIMIDDSVYVLTCMMIEGESRNKYIETLATIVNSFSRENDYITVDNQYFMGFRYSMLYPDNWEQKPIPGSDILVLTPSEGEKDTYRELVSVMLDNNYENQSLEDYVKGYEETNPQNYENYQLIDSKKVKIGELDAIENHYQYTSQKFNFDNNNYTLMVDGKIYVLTCYMLKGESRAKHLDRLKRVVDSFMVEQ